MLCLCGFELYSRWVPLRFVSVGRRVVGLGWYWNSLRTADISPRFAPLRGVSWGGTSATQWQKFHTDDINQCLLNKSSSHGVPKANLPNFTFLLVDFGKVLCSSANELQQNSNASSREDYIPQILTVLLEIHRVYIWPLPPFVFCLSFVNNSWNNDTTPSTN